MALFTYNLKSTVGQYLRTTDHTNTVINFVVTVLLSARGPTYNATRRGPVSYNVLLKGQRS